MILVYSSNITSRTKYIFNVVFYDIIDVKYKLTNIENEYLSFEGPKINYSNKHIKEDEIRICPCGLLNENGINEQEIKITKWGDIPCFFETRRELEIPYDIFSASFYMISRYEEYLPHIKDRHNRFQAEDTIAFKGDFLQKPVVNIWIEKFKTIINKHYPDYKFPEKKFTVIPTFDIDIVYNYLGKDFFRTFGGYMRDLLNLEFDKIIDRTKVLFRLKKDQYDVYDYLKEIKKFYKLDLIFFILFSDFGPYDKNISVNNRNFKLLIKHLEDFADIGIHPSYQSNSNFNLIKKEKDNLSNIINYEITKSRQHFLKLTLPETYRTLIELDITDDYTMGFASLPGFRAGLCTSFYFYDLDSEYETSLKVHPFAFMEGTFREYLCMSPEETIPMVYEIIDEVKKVNGDFLSLWHNASISDYDVWKGWKNVFEKTLEYAFKNK